MKRVVSVTFLIFGLASVSFAQFGERGTNPNSVKGDRGDTTRADFMDPKKFYSNPLSVFGQPIYENDIMYRTSVWRKINLREKQNQPFFSSFNEISRLIIEGVMNGKLQAYYPSSDLTSDGVSQPMDKAKFSEGMTFQDQGNDITLRPEQIYILEIKEDLLFDKRRSRMYWDIQSITLFIPSGVNPNKSYEDFLGTLRYKDLYKYFQEIYKESELRDAEDVVRTPNQIDSTGKVLSYDETKTVVAQGGTPEARRGYWYNPQNQKKSMSFADAFELRLFSSRITKVSNPKNQNIVEIVNEEYPNDPNQAKMILYYSQKVEYDLIEYEHNLWEY